MAKLKLDQAENSRLKTLAASADWVGDSHQRVHCILECTP